MESTGMAHLETDGLSAGELSRYSRHIMLPELDIRGQKKLKSARVLLVGAGGLGSPLGLYLAAAGIGTLGIVDGDVVEDSNLQRQVLFTVDDLGKSKALCAVERLRRLNPHIDCQPHPFALTRENALELIGDYDLVIDGSDNFATRYLVNDACVLAGKPNIYGSVFRFEGQASVFNHGGGPCYRCLFPAPPAPGMAPSCAEAGVLGVVPAIIASIQATEAVKLITGIGESLSGRLLQYDALAMAFSELRIPRDSDCPLCGNRPEITDLVDYDLFCGAPGTSTGAGEIAPEELNRRLRQGEPVVVVDVREPYEREICCIAGSVSIPLQSLPEHIGEFDPGQTLVFYCKSGGRSEQARQLFSRHNFDNVYSLAGGILAWADSVEPELKRY